MLDKFIALIKSYKLPRRPIPREEGSCEVLIFWGNNTGSPASATPSAVLIEACPRNRYLSLAHSSIEFVWPTLTSHLFLALFQHGRNFGDGGTGTGARRLYAALRWVVHVQFTVLVGGFCMRLHAFAYGPHRLRICIIVWKFVKALSLLQCLAQRPLSAK